MFLYITLYNALDNALQIQYEYIRGIEAKDN